MDLLAKQQSKQNQQAKAAKQSGADYSTASLRNKGMAEGVASDVNLVIDKINQAMDKSQKTAMNKNNNSKLQDFRLKFNAILRDVEKNPAKAQKDCQDLLKVMQKHPDKDIQRVGKALNAVVANNQKQRQNKNEKSMSAPRMGHR